MRLFKSKKTQSEKENEKTMQNLINFFKNEAETKKEMLKYVKILTEKHSK